MDNNVIADIIKDAINGVYLEKIDEENWGIGIFNGEKITLDIDEAGVGIIYEDEEIWVYYDSIMSSITSFEVFLMTLAKYFLEYTEFTSLTSWLAGCKPYYIKKLMAVKTAA